ncbi:type I-E CRISPR-associated protein Cse2/CasB [Corynebacterium lubricantis]|uniref:type I-E CRISPR-associated protein Cse2/CasB n=1 Tax=Corynebacterium lubricantis TaxID=541095 RepID=UPI00035DBC55|nr:type I-E CRISPR-associated protein Cse2/CasB [Corynebacterium lubricantis]
MTSPTDTEQPGTKQNVAEPGDAYGTLKHSVRSTCSRLQSMYLSSGNTASTAAARAQLAKLRQGAGASLKSNPLALENVLFALEPRLDPAFLGKGDAPSPSEKAAFSAMTLFAVHMQSAAVPAHETGTSFASACGKLHSLALSGSIKPRIDAMLLAHDDNARLIHVRSLITLLRGHSIAFDYGQFAEDLRSLMNPKKRAGIQLRWGRDFAYGSYTPTTPKNS